MLDPASLQVLIARLDGIAEEMSAVLRRAAFSSNIKERSDFSCALFTAAGELLAQAENIPVHLGSMPASVRAGIDHFDGGRALSPGDDVIVNDPYSGGTHLNDITLVQPCFVGDALVGWAANRAHHADVGGAAPGSLPANATEVYQEGFRIPPVRLTDDVVTLLAANSRTPTERRGDIDAQRGANTVGVQRLASLVGAPLDEILAYGERRMRAVLAQLTDGTWTFEDVIDSYGPGSGQSATTRVRVTLGIDGDEASFDFTGTDEQRAGNVNAVEAVTVSSVAFALRSVVDPTIPANGGALRPVTVIAPSGSIVNARFPAAVGAGNLEVSQRVADVCLGALAQAIPGGVGAASQGTMNNVLIGGSKDTPDGPEDWVYYETIGGGQGGRPLSRAMSDFRTSKTEATRAVAGSSALGSRAVELGPGPPGQSGIHTCMTNTRNTPVEALERAFPLRVLRQRLRRGSGGAGRSRGGEGIERDLQVLTDATVSLITERRISQPWGLAGGEPGAVGENWLLPGGDESRAERLPDKCTIQLKAGDVLRMLTPGGGGWGGPLEF